MTTTGGQTLCGAAYLAVLWTFGGRYGLILGLVVVAAWYLVRPPRWSIWAVSVALMAAAPLAILAQGLPATSVIGGGFGADHLVAHMLVGSSLATALFAALLDLSTELGKRRPAGEGRVRPWRRASRRERRSST